MFCNSTRVSPLPIRSITRRARAAAPMRPAGKTGKDVPVPNMPRKICAVRTSQVHLLAWVLCKQSAFLSPAGCNNVFAGAKFVPSLSVNGVDAYTACCASCTEWWEKTVTCPKLERPENGAPITYTNMRQWPSLATYSCESGYTLSGGYSKRECHPDGQWLGSPPQCIDEPYHGRGGRMGRYNHYDDGNDAAEDVQEVEVEIEWVHEPRSILVNMTCDRSQRHTWADVINM